jgi:dihydropteroate synthase
MGILNVTPDSFSDGGRYAARAQALAHAREMVGQGADVVDVGGESTRPGAQAVSVQEELDRVLPVIEALVSEVAVPISVDTTKPEVMAAAVNVGAGLINDVFALRAPGALETAVTLNVPVCLMHMQNEPRTMQDHPVYRNVVREVYDFLEERIAVCLRAGIDKSKLIVDPGFGFGKTPDHNFELLRELKTFTRLGAPVLAGLSRKSLIGKALGLPPERRLHASVALAILAVQNGARLVRVHDVGPTVEALKMLAAVSPSNFAEEIQ